MAGICLSVTSKEERHLKRSDNTSVYVVFLHFIYKTKFKIAEHFLIHLEFAVLLNRSDKCGIKCSVFLILQFIQSL